MVLRRDHDANELKEPVTDLLRSCEGARGHMKQANEKAVAAQLKGADQTKAGKGADVPSRLALPARKSASFGSPQVRHSMVLADGRQLEYFLLGPSDGAPVVMFDDVIWGTVAFLDAPDACLSILSELGVQVIRPCRPASFLSDPKDMASLRDFARDVDALLTHLQHDRVGVFAASLGGGAALAFAHDVSHRVDRMVLASVCYPKYHHPTSRGLDRHHHLSTRLARLWPRGLHHMMSIWLRGVLKNGDRFFDRRCAESHSMDDTRLLSHPVVRQRFLDMLAQCTVSGAEALTSELVLNARDWDFDVSAIHVPTEIYQGPEDNIAPLAGAELLWDHLPQAVLTVLYEKGHYHSVENWPWLVGRAAGLDLGRDSLIYTLPDA